MDFRLYNVPTSHPLGAALSRGPGWECWPAFCSLGGERGSARGAGPVGRPQRLFDNSGSQSDLQHFTAPTPQVGTTVIYHYVHLTRNMMCIWKVLITYMNKHILVVN